MADDERDDAQHQAPEEQQALALSGALQLQFLAILNNDGWSNYRHIAAHACCELTGQVLRAIVLTDARREQWALQMVEHIRRFVVETAVPGDTRH